MRYLIAAETNVGRTKKVNQDSVLFRHAKCRLGEVLMAVICDGMGGLSKGELASSTVANAFYQWFEDELPKELSNFDLGIIAEKWSLLLRELNLKIKQYSEKSAYKMGTTFTGILLIENQYLIVHVGDTRIYAIDQGLTQLTKDQTLVQREMERGRLTRQEARIDRRRNLLLQCIGASDKVVPEVITGEIEEGIFLLCSDGFYNRLSEEELCTEFQPDKLKDKHMIKSTLQNLVERVQNRNEKDNISALAIKIMERKSDDGNRCSD